MSKKLHAERNERLCASLLSDGVYFDWVVTTAFYSAIHFVQHEMFPYNNGRRIFNNFDAYYNSLQGRKQSKHKETMDLLLQEIPEAHPHYIFLFQTCQTARYHNYNIPPVISQKCLDELKVIKTYLAK